MPSQGPPFFYPDYFPNQRMPFIDDRIPHHHQGPALPPNMPFMAPPYGNQIQFRPPMWGPPAYNYQNNVVPYDDQRHRSNNRNLQPVQGNPHNNYRSDMEEEKTCCICHDRLQNSEERGIHLCDGGQEERETTEEEKSESDFSVELPDMDERLEKLLNELKDCLRNKYESVTETLENYVSSRINKIGTLHKDVLEEKSHLQNLQTELQTRTKELEKREKALREKESQLHKDREKFDSEIQKEKEEICRQWQQLRDEISRMEKLHEVQKGRIKLDIGGVIFTTSRLTLTRDSESMLAAMFSGRHEVRVEDDGTIFIDRDGTHFRYILNYLRDGGIKLDALPRNRQVLRELRNEAVFYQIHGLVQQIEKLI
ncbi:rho-associated protein kinase 1-like [Saccostrea echinata]|uniref:rho-associated protein kinase 1-like n=1 Tax=Saccostrea echinata TaxID=191078 RepID=UPI002A83DC58|nr:rho-associated protein kinase 1-like [Saccostrea echinata]XP_061176874.1 rho-associated protein kinase 1-like [Saccostrea echinata]